MIEYSDVYPKDGNGLGRKESRITIPGNLGEVCPFKEQKVTKFLATSNLSFLDGMQVCDFISCSGDTPA